MLCLKTTKDPTVHKGLRLYYTRELWVKWRISGHLEDFGSLGGGASGQGSRWSPWVEFGSARCLSPGLGEVGDRTGPTMVIGSRGSEPRKRGRDVRDIPVKGVWRR